MVNNLESVLASMDPGERYTLLPHLKILVESKLLSRMANANVSHFVEGRVDLEDAQKLAEEILDIRQTNRVLLGFEESAREITKGID